MSAEVRLEPVAYCADCVDGVDWTTTEEVEGWAEDHNREYHQEDQG